MAQPILVGGLVVALGGDARGDGRDGSPARAPAQITGVGVSSAVGRALDVARAADGNAGEDPDDTDFVAIGTSNGMGVPGTFCADHYDSLWGIYVDYTVGGLYSCRDIASNVYSVGASPSFEIAWSYCDSVVAYRWVLSFGGVDRWCVNATWHDSGEVTAGIETTGASSIARNIDVKFLNLMWTYPGYPGWVAWSKPTWVAYPAGVGYTSAYLLGEYDVYLPPLE